MTSVYVRGRKIALDPSRVLGAGGEADVFAIEGGEALKIWKTAAHRDCVGDPAAARAAEARIALQQSKMRAFPTNLPSAVAAPLALATDRTGGTIAGFVMRLVAGAEPIAAYSEPARLVSSTRVMTTFRALAAVVTSLHGAGVVIGDFNDMNVLVDGAGVPTVIDCDSFQFGRFPCPVFTERFLDPRLCATNATVPKPAAPFDADSDWFAFHALLFQSLLGVGPYGGVHRPPAASRRVAHGERSLRRITVFDADVRYPKPARPLASLPDELLHHFEVVFARGGRGALPAQLFDIHFVRCGTCGLEHGRLACPRCHLVALVPAPPEPAVVRGAARARRIFPVEGRPGECVIVAASVEGSRLRFVAHDGRAYLREDGRVVAEGALDPSLRFALRGDDTLIARGERLVVVRGPTSSGRGEPVASLSVDDGKARFGVSSSETRGALFLVDGGQLCRFAPLAASGVEGCEPWGAVLARQTHVFVGSTFGLGFYRAGGVASFFVFDVARRGLNDGVAVQPFTGELVRAAATLSATRAWLLLTLDVGAQRRRLLVVVSRSGEVLAQCDSSEGTALGNALGAGDGAVAVGDALLVPTDGGVVRAEVVGATVAVTREFPDTEPFVDAGVTLLAGPAGLFVVRRHEIHLLTLDATSKAPSERRTP